MKKNKHIPRGGIKISPVVVIVLIGLVAFGILAPHHGANDHPVTLDADDGLHSLEQHYFAKKAKNTDHWWMEHLPKPNETVKLQELISSRLVYTREVLDRYRSVSPLAERVAEHFSVFYVTLAIDNQSSVAMMSEEEMKKLTKSVPELTFISKDKTAIISAPYAMYWRSDWGMMMHAVDYPPAVFASFLYHELGHGLLHPVHSDAKYYESSSPEYALEECRMHELETLVNDRASGATFKKVVARVLSKAPKAASAREAVLALNAKDLDDLDRTLGATNAGFETASPLFAEYLMAIGLEYISVHGQGDKEKMEFFQWVQTILN